MIGKNQEIQPSKVITESETSFTFTVDSVAIEKKPPTLVKANKLLEQYLGSEVKYEDFSHRTNNEDLFIQGKVQGFILALHTAYQNHYPLKLSVSDFIILIGQGLGSHMDKYSEKLRKYFVDHEGKEKIIVRRHEFVLGKQNDWSTVFGDFADEIKKRVKTDFHSIVIDDTSVATRESRIVSEITLMDCMKGYFSYAVQTLCGIPQVTLEGSVKDWENLLSRVNRLEELNKDDCLLLDFWLKHLIPVVKTICETGISRKPNSEFWSGIYKYKNPGSGSPYISGWCTVFLPYLKQRVNSFDNPNHVTTAQIPEQISILPFVWEYLGKDIAMKFSGGFLGAKFDQTKGTVEPTYFWAVTYDEDNKGVEEKSKKSQLKQI